MSGSFTTVLSNHSAPIGSNLFPILAHQGGWDEVLLVGIPLGIIGLLLWIANRRVNSQLEAADRLAEQRPEQQAEQESGPAK